MLLVLYVDDIVITGSEKIGIITYSFFMVNFTQRI